MVEVEDCKVVLKSEITQEKKQFAIEKANVEKTANALIKESKAKIRNALKVARLREKEGRVYEKKKKIKLKELNRVLNNHCLLGSIVSFDDELGWMKTMISYTRFEILDYKGKLISKGDKLEIGLGGFHYVYDEMSKLYTLYSYETDTNIKRKLFETKSLQQLEDNIEKVDPGRRLGFKFYGIHTTNNQTN